MPGFHETLTRLGFRTYADYLAASHWSEFKATYKSSGRSMRCAVCDTRPIQLHHHTYVRLGCESLDDVTPLCRPHHVAVHEWLKTSGRIYVEYTFEAVASLRGVPVTVRHSPRGDERIKKPHKRSKSDRATARDLRPAVQPPTPRKKWKKKDKYPPAVTRPRSTEPFKLNAKAAPDQDAGLRGLRMREILSAYKGGS